VEVAEQQVYVERSVGDFQTKELRSSNTPSGGGASTLEEDRRRHCSHSRLDFSVAALYAVGHRASRPRTRAPGSATLGLCYQFYHCRFYQFGPDNSVIGLMCFVPITYHRGSQEKPLKPSKAQRGLS